MRLLIVTQYFWPEHFIINDFSQVLASSGHEVTVLTGKPNYPGGEVFSGYSERGVERERLGADLEVLRVPLRPRRRGRGTDLAVNYLSFIWSGLRHGPALIGDRPIDAILVFAPSPVLSAIPAVALKRKTGAHLALWIQDLWPESLQATGFVKNRLVLGAVGLVVSWIYAACDTLLVQSEAFRDSVARYGSADKIAYLPNSCLDHVAEAGQQEIGPTLSRILDEHFCVMFAGNIGQAQDMDAVLLAARHLKSEPGVKLVLVGSGSALEWVREEKKRLDLDNLILAGRYPAAMMPSLLRRAEGLLVTLRGDDILTRTIPSKVQTYLAAGRPIVGCLDGEGGRVIREARAGVTCPAGDARGLADAVLALHRMDPDERAALGAAGRRYFLDNFEMTKQAGRLIEILTDRIGSVDTPGVA